MINALARYHKVELHETPVGFAYIGELIKQGKVSIRGEESAGLSLCYQVPEKDGVLAGLMYCEMVARRGKPWGDNCRSYFPKLVPFARSARSSA